MPEKKHIQYSANFKRDYVAGLAIVIFFAIVIGEVLLAIGIPSYLNRESSMAFQVRRLNMLNDFDSLRSRVARTKVDGKDAAAEVKLIQWTVDHLARYVRTHRDDLSSEEISDIHKVVKELRTTLQQIQKDGAFSRQARLNTGGYIDTLLTKKGIVLK